MAPIRPPTHSETPHKTTKALKRASKHATLLSRITKSSQKPKPLKRRRPSRKLVTGLEELVDALPATERRNSGQERAEGEGEGKIKHKSLKSRPGAGKKKEKLVAMERERFARNLALMSGGPPGVAGEVVDGGRGEVASGSGSTERWAAIRGFISQTMERRIDGEKT